jgi:circadian clock protein KaiC
MPSTSTPRITTGIPGLDPVIEGGFLVGGVYIVQGPPGSGKTILANQLCCHHARSGQRAIYFTLLSESHSGMFAHLQRMAFVCEELIGDALVYFSGFQVLESEGLAGLAKLIGKTMADRRATLVVVDGFVTASEASPAPHELKQFVRQVQTFSASNSCTTLLLSSSDPHAGIHAEHTIVDGIIELTDDLNGLRSLRHLQVRKMRGTREIRGRHSMEITDRGITVHARFEADLTQIHKSHPVGPERHGFGIRELDAMMRDGVPSGSITMVLGASGVGKTTLLLQFLAAGAAAGDPGLYFGMYEQPDALLAKSKRINLGLQAGVDTGLLRLIWERPIEGVLDILADRLIAQVRETGARRLCIDGLHSLFRTVDFPERMRAVAAALAEELASLGVTTLYTLETPELVSGSAPLRIPLDDLSALSHNVIAIRQVERDARFDRMLAILKMRDSDYDRSIRELTITDNGIALSKQDHRPRRGVAPIAGRRTPAGSRRR